MSSCELRDQKVFHQLGLADEDAGNFLTENLYSLHQFGDAGLQSLAIGKISHGIIRKASIVGVGVTGQDESMIRSLKRASKASRAGVPLLPIVRRSSGGSLRSGVLRRYSPVCGLLLGLFSACGGMAPLPQEIAARLPPERHLGEAERARVSEHTQAAVERLFAGEHAMARKESEAALAFDPRQARARAVRAHCLMKDAREETPPILAIWSRAEGELLLAWKLAPKDPVVGLLRAQFFEEDGHLSSAAVALEISLASSPDDLSLLRMATRLRYELGEERQALPLLHHLLELEPKDSDALYRLGCCSLEIAESTNGSVERRELLKNAVAAFRRHRDLSPDDIDNFIGEARARFLALDSAEEHTKEMLAILALYEQAAKIAPSSAEPDFGRGVIFAELGRAKKSRVAYERALVCDPQHVGSLLNLAASLAAAGEHSDARDLCHRALKLDLTSAERRRVQSYLAKPPG